MLVTSIFSYSHNVFKSPPFNPFDKRQILDSSKLKEFADNHFKVDEQGGKFFKRIENPVGKEEIACNKQFLLFLHCFQKTCTADM